jgi:hypothetical protein
MKILFVHKYKDDEFEVEKLWCNAIESNKYIVDNIPFIVKRVALGDIITAEFDEDEKEYYFDSFVEISGNSTIRLYFEKENDIEKVRGELNSFGCEAEIFLQRKILAVNIPKCLDYKPIKEYLEGGRQLKLWEYEESCLAHDY